MFCWVLLKCASEVEKSVWKSLTKSHVKLWVKKGSFSRSQNLTFNNTTMLFLEKSSQNETFSTFHSFTFAPLPTPEEHTTTTHKKLSILMILNFHGAFTTLFRESPHSRLGGWWRERKSALKWITAAKARKGKLRKNFTLCYGKKRKL